MSYTTNYNGIDYFKSVLSQWGLNSATLIEWANQKLLAGESIDKILFDMEQRPEFNAAFPEIKARRDKMDQTGNPLSPISPGQVLDYRTQAKSLMRSAGLPPSYYENPQVTYNLIVNDKSLSELSDSLDLLQKRVANAPPQIGAVFDEIFGADSRSALFLAFTNDQLTLPALQNMVQEAEAGGAARRLGFDLTVPEMQKVADTNISYDDAVAAFSKLDTERSLFNETISERQDLTVGGAGIEAAFNLGGEGARQLEQRAKARTAETAGAGGELETEKGATGLGVAGQR